MEFFFLQKCEADRLPPSSAETEDAWNFATTPQIRLHGVVLSHRDNITFTVY
jgi:hypothetical protein